MSTNMTLIEAKTLGASTSNVTFSSIPQTYTDLKLVMSVRDTVTGTGNAWVAFDIYFNGSNTNLSGKHLFGTGSAAGSNSVAYGYANEGGTTSNTFSNNEIYIPNYTSSNYKSYSADQVTENNATAALSSLIAGLWSSTSAITSITCSALGTAFAANSTFYLYGISNVTSTTKATGGIVSSDGTYNYHMFPFSGTFTPTSALTADILVIAGGGGAGYFYGGGGGAGGVRQLSSQSLTTTNYTATIGNGGAGAGNSSTKGTSGTNSSFSGSGFTTITASGGGGGGSNSNNAGLSGGSGGGGSNTGAAGSGNSGGYSPVEGYAGHSFGASNKSGGGGGAGGAANGSTGRGDGANGTSAYSSWGSATNTGHNVIGTYYYAGGGSGAPGDTSLGGYGGGGGAGGMMFPSYNGAPNTGGGGGSDAGSGGSGLIIIRYAI